TDQDGSPGGQRRTQPPYLVLVVDDDPEVHAVTRIVLGSFRYLERGIKVLSASSGPEAQEVLRSEPDIAVVFMDVVMEAEDTGLSLVQWIREDLGNREVRVVLRTGQPGQMPERDIILRYDINDYKSKTELTETKLVTTLIASLRSFDQIRELAASRRALEVSAHSLEDRVEERTRALAASELRLRTILDASLFPVFIEEQKSGEILFANDRAAEHFGLCAEELKGRLGASLWVNAANRESFLAQLNIQGRLSGGEAHFAGQGDGGSVGGAAKDPDGDLGGLPGVEEASDTFWGLVSAIGTDYDGKAAILFTFTDISARKKIEEDLKRQATTDSLTGIANRRYFLERAGAEIKRARRFNQPLSMVLFDIDRFKHVNDSYGHAAGDKVLVAVVETVSASL
ncbi:MAG: diguanylate cyclase, partial [Rhodospirillaceae bacterium]